MAACEVKNDDLAAAACGVGDAVGVNTACKSGEYWFAAVVNHNTEKSVSKKLDALGIENYVATQSVYRVWKNGRRAKVERVVIPCYTFIRCTEALRRKIVCLPYINRFLTNKARRSAANGLTRVATIPESDMSKLRFMLGQTQIPVEIKNEPYKQGDRVRILRGALQGLIGEISEVNKNKCRLTVNLNLLGFATVEIETSNLEPWV